jgi:hypothetical protein
VTPAKRIRRIRGWSPEARFTLAASLALIVGSLAPWIGFSPDGPFHGGGQYILGIETNAGTLTFVLGAIAVWALNRPAGPRAAATSGAIAALALLAGALVLVTLIHRLNDDPYGPMWGLWLSGAAAVAMLVGVFLIESGSGETLPPPD